MRNRQPHLPRKFPARCPPCSAACSATSSSSISSSRTVFSRTKVTLPGTFARLSSKRGMEFKITHTTQYRYGHPAAEAYGEARLTPPELPTQTVVARQFEIEPATKTSGYVDHYGNAVEFYSLPFRHRSLSIANRLVVRTTLPAPP